LKGPKLVFTFKKLKVNENETLG